jgi:DNA modification methylase
MSIYYRDDNATLYMGDCRDVLPALEPADLIVTDPPYGVEFRSNRRGDKFDFIAEDDDPSGMASLVGEAIRSNLKRYRHAYVFGPLDFSPLVIAGIVQEPMSLIWDKGVLGMGNLSLPWASQHEDIQFMVAVKSKANVGKGEGRLAARLRRGSILTHQRPHAAGVTRHPTEKPVPLLRELIESSSCFGEVVLDPFVGSGSTLVAAALEGRKSIGVELEEKYCEIAAKRLSAIADAVRAAA